MAGKQLVWDAIGAHKFETGVEKGVLYLPTAGVYSAGYAWNGLTGVTESPAGAEATDLYADDIKYAVLRSAETFGGTIEAYTFPDEFGACDGSASLATGVTIGQQTRSAFGLAYRTKLGDDSDPDAATHYKLHLVYGATAAPSEKAYSTVNDSPEAITLSWEFSTVPVVTTGFKPTSLIVIDSTKADPAKLAALEAILYGSETLDPRLPLPDEIKTLMTAA
jgi:hypothetical protein